MSPIVGEAEAPDLVCRLDSVQGMVDALSSVRWKRHQDAVIELSEHGIVLIVEETGCLQAKVYLKRELFLVYEYTAEDRPRFGLSLGLFVDCLNTFSAPGHSPVVEIRYPGPDMQLLLKCALFLFAFASFVIMHCSAAPFGIHVLQLLLSITLNRILAVVQFPLAIKS